MNKGALNAEQAVLYDLQFAEMYAMKLRQNWPRDVDASVTVTTANKERL